MLVEFRFGNFRSFRDEQTLSLVAASKLQADADLDRANIFLARDRPELKLLRVGAIYGANAGGKSNVILALAELRALVSISANLDRLYRREPFYLDTISRERPTSFEITFVRDSALYRYGCEVSGARPFPDTPAAPLKVDSEWLYRANSSRESLLFERTGDTVTRGPRFHEGTALLKKGEVQRNDALFLSLCAQIGGEITSQVADYLTHHVQILTGLEDDSLRRYTESHLQIEEHRAFTRDLLQRAGTGVTDLHQSDGEETLPAHLRQAVQRVEAFHPMYGPDGEIVDQIPLSLREFTSQGTQRLFAYASPLFDTLKNGYTLVVDEIDARFHPLLTREIIRLFQSSETNPKNAQIIFATHDTNLLDPRQFRRDQIWFVEKDRFGASHLYSLAEFKGIRKDANFEQEYLNGRYGAIPFLGGFSKLFDDTEKAAAEEPAGAAG